MARKPTPEPSGKEPVRMKDTPVNVASQLKEDYLAYSMAVLLGRAVPDLYDGLKPGQRRVLQTMFEENLKPDGRFVKCARVTGLTMAYYHPHGGCYGSLVNMATPWNNNVMWVNGHGNFGSTTDGPAAERYTECKLRPSAVDLLLQNRETWVTQPNYDGSKKEAVRFNSAIPTVLLNGDSGIAVGFATRLAPHNLRDVVSAVKLSQKNRKKAVEILIPDFPTGCDIVEDEGLESYKSTGSGAIRCRAKMEIGLQQRDGRAKDRETLTFTHLPPHTNPERIGEQIKEGLEKQRISGVAEIVDESDLTGDRLLVIAKPNVDAKQLSKELYAYTDLDSKFSTKTLVIDGVKPVELSPLDICTKWFSWRMDRLRIQFDYERSLSEARLHIVEGLLKAIDKMDLIIKKIRASKDKSEAKQALMGGIIKLSDAQADAVLEMRLRQLTGLDHETLKSEKADLDSRIKELKHLISNDSSRQDWIYTQIDELAKRHGNARRSRLIAAPDALVVTKKEKGESQDVKPVSRPRFLKIDLKKGIIEQTKGPRGATVVDSKEKLIVLTRDGLVRKLPAHFKGPLAEKPCEITIIKREAEIETRKYLVVFELEDHLRAFTLNGSDLCRSTQRAKPFIPENASLVFMGEDPYTLKVGKRKKEIKLDLSVKEGRPGAKGLKIAKLEEIAG